jgi:hypothetical protein
MNIKSLRLALEQAAIRSTHRDGLQRQSLRRAQPAPGRNDVSGRRAQVSSTRERRTSAIKTFARIAHPTVDAAGRRTPALRFGDPRVIALTGALCQTLLAATGFTNKNLRVLIAGLLGSDYRPGQMTYDLRRLRLAGFIRRRPHANRYQLTPEASASLSSTPRSMTGCSSRSPLPTNPKPHPSSEQP